MKKRDKIGNGLLKVVEGIRKFGLEVTKMRCDNAGENKKHIYDVANKLKILMEMTVPDTLQMNRVVVRRISVLKDMSVTMMAAAKLSKTGAEPLVARGSTMCQCSLQCQYLWK